MFENVLVGVDGAPGGRDAITLASQLLADGGSLTLAYVYGGYTNPARAITPGMVGEDRDRALALLERERAQAGVQAEVVGVEAVSPGRGLHVQAESQGADLLVLGSCRRSLFGRAMLGDDTRAAINGSPCAVAVAPAGHADNVAPFASIGVGYDGSPESRAALAAARELASPTRARIYVLEVVSFPNYMYTGLVPSVSTGIDELVRAADARLKALPDVEGRAVYGLAGEELAAFSKEVDLLVLGSRGYGPAGRLVHGSTSGYVQHHAHAPVMILPRGTRYAKAAELSTAGEPVTA